MEEIAYIIVLIILMVVIFLKLRWQQRDIRYIYLIHDPKNSGLYKIGFSKDPKRRLKELNGSTKLPVELGFKMIHTIETDNVYRAEKILHKKYGAYRKNGEWFELSRRHVGEIRKIKRL